jgi:ectoine hydroxylase-related dioxygenase (phytanoyl-CoA dioxygenase family)
MPCWPSCARSSETAFPHPLKVARLIFPWHQEVSTPPHQDYPNNQGTPGLTATWIPLGNCSMDLGGLAILRGSHRFGVLPQAFHLGAGNRRAVVPPEVLEQCRWVTTDYSIGDVLVFGSMTLHASLHNATEVQMRLSADFRYQCEGADLTDLVLEPHFQRLTWDEIYADWSSATYQYYWRGLDCRVVPFDRDRFEQLEVTDDQFQEEWRYERRLAARYERARSRE